jgi:hypothetical protein
MVMSLPRLWQLTYCTTNYRLILSSERVPDEEQSNCPTKERKRKNLVMGPKWVPDTKTDRLTDRRSQHQLNSTESTVCHVYKRSIIKIQFQECQWSWTCILLLAWNHLKTFNKPKIISSLHYNDTNMPQSPKNYMFVRDITNKQRNNPPNKDLTVSQCNDIKGEVALVTKSRISSNCTRESWQWQVQLHAWLQSLEIFSALSFGGGGFYNTLCSFLAVYCEMARWSEEQKIG